MSRRDGMWSSSGRIICLHFLGKDWETDEVGKMDVDCVKNCLTKEILSYWEKKLLAWYSAQLVELV